MPQDPKEQALRFIRLLYADKPESDFILIWQLQGRKSHWFQNIDEAAAFAAGRRDMYIGVGLSPEAFKVPDPERPGEFIFTLRCKADQITGIGGLWADIDIANPHAHKKGNLPPTEADGLKILKSMNARPTAVIRSGYGLQAWWAFKEPWIFADDGERQLAADLAQRWNQYVIQKAAAAGYEADSIGDLSRVMRLPGTFNAKVPEDPRPVSMRWGDETRRWNPTELIEIVDDLKIVATAKPEAKDGVRKWERSADEGLNIRPDRQPPIDKYQEALKSRNFRDTVEHRRPTLKDQSTSGYDMSLAVQAVRRGWTDQEVTDLLIFHQREKRTGGVRDRPEYFRNTIAAARKISAPEPALESLRKATGLTQPNAETREAKDEEEPPPFHPDADENSTEYRAGMLRDLSETFHVKISAILRTMSQPPLYRLKTERGEIVLGEVSNLIEQRALRNKVATIGVYLKKRKEEDWEPIATALLRACEDEDVTPDATDAGQLANWLKDYLRETITVDTAADAESSDNPIRKEGRLLIASTALRKFLIVQAGERSLTSRDLCSMLRRTGARPTTVFLKDSDKRTTRHRWILPGKSEDYEA